MKIDYSEFFQTLEETPLNSWIEQLPPLIAKGLSHERHGNLKQWEAALQALPQFNTTSVELNTAVAVQGEKTQGLEALLKPLMPWRKGPFFHILS